MEKGPQSNESYARKPLKPYHFNRTLGAQKASSKYCQTSLPSNESYESKTGCNRTLPTVLWVPLTPPVPGGVAPKFGCLKRCRATRGCRNYSCGPNLLFLAFLFFLAFFVVFKEFLAILSVFPFFPKDFRGSASRRNPCRFGGFPCCFPKRQGKEDQGINTLRNRIRPASELRSKCRM